MSTALHILVGHQNVVGWHLMFICMRTPPIRYNITGDQPPRKLTLRSYFKNQIHIYKDYC
jgi:hypothetical protein